jgi:hypothetical protein
MDQPSFIWDLIQIAGVEYERKLREFQEEEIALEKTRAIARSNNAT